jgi:hypothetical protein
MTTRTWWRGRQWRVVPAGLETVDGKYFIAADRLLKSVPPRHKNDWPWPRHMLEKNWVDIEDFCDAWIRALELHGMKSPAAASVCQQVLSGSEVIA